MKARMTGTWRRPAAAATAPASLAGPHFAVGDGAGVRLTVILPVYNEAAVVGRSLDAVAEYAASHPEYRFVFVDDGSTDATAELLRARLGGDQGGAVSFLALPRNVGKGGAIKAALGLAVGPYVGFTDGDLAYSLDHLPALAEALRTHDLAIGSRFLKPGDRGRPGVVPSRRALGRAFNRMVRVALGLPYRDTQAGLKGFRAEAAERLFGAQRVGGFGFDAEVLFLARKFGYRVAEVPAQVRAEHAYKSAKGTLLKNAARMLCQVVAIRVNHLAGRYK